MFNSKKRKELVNKALKVFKEYDGKHRNTYDTLHLPELLNDLINNKCDLNSYNNNDRMTIFMYLCKYGHKLKIEKYMKIFIDNGAKVNFRVLNFDNTPLIFACSNSNIYSSNYIVKLLIEHGADLNLQGGLGNSALVYACSNALNENASIETVRILIDVGANVDLQNDSGDTALMHTINMAGTSQKEIMNQVVIILLSKQNDLRLINTSNRTALQMAIINDNMAKNVIELLTQAESNDKKEIQMQSKKIFLSTECSICMDSKPNIMLDKCGHVLCNDCFEKYKTKCSTCNTVNVGHRVIEYGK